MAKKPKFNNVKVTELCVDYLSKKQEDISLRNKIMIAVMPLINAALIQRNVPQEKNPYWRFSVSCVVLF